MTESAIRLKVDRDSVCAGDDCVSHAVFVVVAPETTFVEVLKAAQKACPLAGVSGGNATWLIDTNGYGKGCVGVIAQQWKEPKLLISQNAAVSDIWGNTEGSAVAGAECNTVIELKPEHHAALPWHFA